MDNYEKLKIVIVKFEETDIITDSVGNDDQGRWQS